MPEQAPKRLPPQQSLQSYTREQFQQDSKRILAEAKHGKQVVIVDESGKIRTIVGMNGARFLPEPPSDTLADFESWWHQDE